MMNGAATNGAGSVPEGWLTADELQKKFGGSSRTVRRWGELGRIGRMKDAHGRAFFDPSDYARELRSEEGDDEASGKFEVQREGIVIDGANSLLRQTMQHLEKVMAPAADAQRELLQLLKEENSSLRQQVKDLTAVHLENMKAREALISEAHERELELKAFEAREARKKAALDMVKGPAQKLLARVAGVGADTVPAPAGKLTSARALLASLTDEQLTTLFALEAVRETLPQLLGLGVLTEEQEGLVREVLL